MPSNYPKKICLKLIKIYQFFSKLTPQNCRFYPTCSQYTYTAVEKFGIFRGIYLGAKRILKCHPYNEGGFDPVPQEFHF